MSASSKKKLRKEQNAAQITEKQLQQQKEAKKLKNYTLAFVVVIAAVLCIAICSIAVTAYVNSGILERNTDAITINDHTLSNAELNYFFVDTVRKTYSDWYNQYYEQYGENAEMYISVLHGLSMTTPLNEQPYDKETTYADYFTKLAIEDATSAYSIYDAAVAAGHTLTEEEQADLDSVLDTMELYANLYGYTNVKDYLKGSYGNGAQEKSYRKYLEVTSLAQSYQVAYSDALTYEAADLDAYNKEHYNDFSSFTYSSFYLNPEVFVECTAEEGDTEHTHTDEEKAAALKAAEEAANKLAASGATTSLLFDEAIAEIEAYAENETAASTKSERLIYTKITNKDIATWLADDARKAGDLTVIPDTVTTTDDEGNETTETNGYYVVMFESKTDNLEKLVTVRHILAEFEGGTTDDDGNTVYADTEKKAALDKINEVKQQWLDNGGTVEAFEALVKDNTDDTGSAETGGLYEDVYPGQMVKAFNDWCFDASRKAGDYEVVETEYGYHLIYFVETQDVTYRDHMVQNALRANDFEAWYNGVIEAASVTELDTSRLTKDMTIS